MIHIGQKNFNIEMDSYLARRKKEDQIKKEKDEPINGKEEDAEEDAKEATKTPSQKKSVVQKFLNFIYGDTSGEEKELSEEEKKEFEEEYHELEKAKPGFFQRFKSWFYLSKDEEEYIDEEIQKEEPVVNEDIIEALKIQNRWLSQLPQKKIKEFKDSEDYRKYKEILAKYGLIKRG